MYYKQNSHLLLHDTIRTC